MGFGTILLSILIFSLLIFVHELGHFMAAKWAGIRVKEFALGMGPALFKVERGETVYALRLFPIGGFVSMEGEDQNSEDPQAFCNAKLHKRMVVASAGAAMNLVLGVIVLGILTAQLPLLGTTEISSFREEAVSNQVLQENDVILRVNGRRVRTNNDLVHEFLRERDGTMEMVIQRAGVAGTMMVEVPFRMQAMEEDESMKFIYMDFNVIGVDPTVGGVVRHTFNWAGSVVKQVWGALADLVTGRYGFNQLSGPVGTTEAIGKASSYGWDSLLLLVAFITINLGVFNLLPLPALDGGRLLFMLVELVRRKPVSAKYEGYVHAAGFALLMLLMVSVTFNDVLKLFQ